MNKGQLSIPAVLTMLVLVAMMGITLVFVVDTVVSPFTEVTPVINESATLFNQSSTTAGVWTTNFSCCGKDKWVDPLQTSCTTKAKPSGSCS